MPEPRQAPYNITTEQGVLGSLMRDTAAFDDVRGTLRLADFYRVDHQVIYEAICEQHVANLPGDFISISEHLRGKGRLEDVGGMAYLGSLIDDTYSPRNVPHYARLLRDLGVQRELIGVGQHIAELGWKADGRQTNELLALASSYLQRAEPESAEEAVFVSEFGAQWLERLAHQRETGESPAISTGFRDIDSATDGGIRPGELWVLLGRSGMGKTQLALNIADNVATSVGTVVVYSLEMPKEALMTRLIARRTDLNLASLKQPKRLSEQEVDSVVWSVNRLNSTRLIIDDRGGRTIEQMRSRCRVLKRKHGLKLVVVDYYQRQRVEDSRGENRTNQLGAISAAYKQIAMELGIGIIVLAQPDRQGDKRDNPRPKRGEIRECGDLENDADLIAGLYREDRGAPDSIHTGIAEFIILKQRDGEERTVEITFEGRYSRCGDYDGPTYKQRVMDATPASEKKEKKPAGFKKPRAYGDID